MERLGGDGVFEARLEFVPLQHSGVQLRPVGAPLPLPGRFRGVQGQVGMFEQFFRVGAVLRAGYAHAGREADHSAREPERLGETLDYLLGEHFRGCRFLRTLHEHRELVTPQARCRVTARSVPVNRRATAMRSSSPTEWPLVSLTTLKSSRSTNSTQVRVEARRPRSSARSIRSSRSTRFGEAGEPVVEGTVGEFLLQFALLGHVAQGEDQSVDGLVVPQVAASDLHIDASAALLQDLPVVAAVQVVLGAHPSQGLRRPLSSWSATSSPSPTPYRGDRPNIPRRTGSRT